MGGGRNGTPVDEREAHGTELTLGPGRFLHHAMQQGMKMEYRPYISNSEGSYKISAQS